MFEIKNVEEKMIKAINSLKERFTNIQAGRANANILNEVKVSYYGTMTPIRELANILATDAHTLQVKPFDKSILKDIEKGIFEANLNLTPTNNGEIIIIAIPAMTETRRLELVKQSKEISEEAKVAIRNIRQDANNDIKKLEVSEDAKKGNNEDVQELTNKYNKVIEDVLKEKEKELMTI